MEEQYAFCACSRGAGGIDVGSFAQAEDHGSYHAGHPRGIHYSYDNNYVSETTAEGCNQG